MAVRMNIVNLPEEVLVLIFEYLSGEDKLNLHTACRTFDRIMTNNKTLTRKLNFARCYTADISSLKDFLKPVICKNVRELDLTSCYWLKSVDVVRCVLKLSNLEALHVADTSLSIRNVINIVQTLSQLKRLSFSLSPVSIHDVDLLCSNINVIAPELQSLEFLFVYVKGITCSTYDVIVLRNWLACCINLTELWVIVPRQFRYHSDASSIGALHFPHLHTLVLSCSFPSNCLRDLFSVIVRGCQSVRSWQCFWVSDSEIALEYQLARSSSCGVFESARTLLDSGTSRGYMPDVCPNVQHLSLHNIPVHKLERSIKKLNLNCLKFVMPWDLLCISDTNLEELNVNQCTKNIQSIPPQKNLHKLALPVCIIAGDGGSCLTSYIVEKFPNTEEFEFTRCAGHGCRSSSWKDTPTLEASFLVFSKWKNLRRFKLEGIVSISCGKFFSEVFRSCEKLESISLTDLGLAANCNYLFELLGALKFCKNLKDFRIDQPNMCSIDRLFSALQLCPVIERVCVISRGSKLSMESVLVDFVCGAAKLVFLFVSVDSLTSAACKRIQSEISARCKNRPTLNVSLLQYMSAFLSAHGIAKLPAVHFFEMFEDVSRIGTKFGNWYLKFRKEAY